MVVACAGQERLDLGQDGWWRVQVGLWRSRDRSDWGWEEIWPFFRDSEQIGLKPKRDLTVFGDSEQFGLKPKRDLTVFFGMPSSSDWSQREIWLFFWNAKKIHDEAEKDRTEAEVAFDPHGCAEHAVCLLSYVKHALMSRNIIFCSWLILRNKLPSSLNFLMNWDITAPKFEVQSPQTAPIVGGIFSDNIGTASNLTARWISVRWGLLNDKIEPEYITHNFRWFGNLPTSTSRSIIDRI